MPTYDYRCDVNGRVVEVRHAMNEQLNTWGELCRRAGQDIGATAADAPVQRLANGGQIVRSSSLGDAATPACSSGPCCPTGICGLS